MSIGVDVLLSPHLCWSCTSWTSNCSFTSYQFLPTAASSLALFTWRPNKSYKTLFRRCWNLNSSGFVKRSRQLKEIEPPHEVTRLFTVYLAMQLVDQPTSLLPSVALVKPTHVIVALCWLNSENVDINCCVHDQQKKKRKKNNIYMFKLQCAIRLNPWYSLLYVQVKWNFYRSKDAQYDLLYMSEVL